MSRCTDACSMFHRICPTPFGRVSEQLVVLCDICVYQLKWCVLCASFVQPDFTPLSRNPPTTSFCTAPAATPLVSTGLKPVFQSPRIPHEEEYESMMSALSLHFADPYASTEHLVAPHHTALHHTAPHHTRLHHTTPHHTTLPPAAMFPRYPLPSAHCSVALY